MTEAKKSAGFVIESRRGLLPFRDKRVVLVRIYLSLFMILCSAGLMIAVHHYTQFAEYWFEFSKKALSVLSQIFSFWKYSVAEVIVYAFLAGMLIYIALFLVRLVKSRVKKPVIFRFLSMLLLIVSVVGLLFIGLHGANYSAPPLGEKLSLDVKSRPVGELINTTLAVLAQADYYSGNVSRTKAGPCDFGDFFDMADGCVSAYDKFFREYPNFAVSFCPPAKYVSSGVLMSYFGISGIFFPFTGESNVNPNNLETQLPFTMAHEMAHRLAIAREDEANFMAFLVLSKSDETGLKYTAYLNAYIYAINAIYSLSPETAYKIMKYESPALTKDLDRIRQHLSKYEGKIKDAGQAINDRYLVTMGEPDGVQSYGRMVDLLISYYEKMHIVK